MKKGKLSTKASLMIRILVGAYLIYILIELFPKIFISVGVEKIIFTCAVILFACSGIAMIIFSIKDLLTGKYEGGALDSSSDNHDDSTDI